MLIDANRQRQLVRTGFDPGMVSFTNSCKPRGDNKKLRESGVAVLPKAVFHVLVELFNSRSLHSGMHLKLLLAKSADGFREPIPRCPAARSTRCRPLKPKSRSHPRASTLQLPIPARLRERLPPPSRSSQQGESRAY